MVPERKARSRRPDRASDELMPRNAEDRTGRPVPRCDTASRISFHVVRDLRGSRPDRRGRCDHDALGDHVSTSRALAVAENTRTVAPRPVRQRT